MSLPFSMSAAVQMDPEEAVLSIPVLWRGEKFLIQIDGGSTLGDLGKEVQRVTSVKADTMRFIVSQCSSKDTKLYSPFSEEHSCLSLHDVHIIEGKLIRMMGISKEEADELLQISKKDLRIIGFEEEERRLRQRSSGKSARSLKPPQGTYIFSDFKPLEIPGLQLNPPPSEALKRMHMLASDPGIIAVMNKHRWRVGLLTEMAPVGYVGISPKCLLGLNKNFGEEISLRLRTDDLKGFRNYDSVKKTLLHELAHMVYSEHDADFYALDRQLNHEAATLDWTKSKGYSLNGKREAMYDGEGSYSEEHKVSYRLGGGESVRTVSPRDASITAAYRRFVDSSTNVMMADEVSNRPIADDHGSCKKDELATLSPRGKIVNSMKKTEPDPDGCILLHESFMEPDPDALLKACSVGFAHEPDPDACAEADGFVSLVNGIAGIGESEDGELKRIEDLTINACTRLQKAVEMLRHEVESTNSSAVLQTLFKILRNLIEHPEEMKFKRLRVANPLFQKTIANHKAAMEFLSLVGFVEDTILDELGKVERYLVMARNDPALLWLAKSSLEASSSC